MNTPDEFTNLRRYPRGGVWATLAIPETRLKEWVTDGPYRARGSSNVRGVWFIYDDIVVLGGLLPQVMTSGQANVVPSVRLRFRPLLTKRDGDDRPEYPGVCQSWPAFVRAILRFRATSSLSGLIEDAVSR
jgi:hypothetical protein